jgi:hypothetical protein
MAIVYVSGGEPNPLPMELKITSVIIPIFNMPERTEMTYQTSTGTEVHPVVSLTWKRGVKYVFMLVLVGVIWILRRPSDFFHLAITGGA